MQFKSIYAHAQGKDHFYRCTFKPDIVYHSVDGLQLKLQLIVPMTGDKQHLKNEKE